MALSNLDSITKRLIAQESGGIMSRFFCSTIGSTTSVTTATTQSSATCQRFPLTYTLPSLTGYTGWELNIEMECEDVGGIVAALEYDLGVLTVSTNTFAAGTDSSTPTIDTRINGTDYASTQTASMIPMLFVSSTLTATTPTITITYNNEDGTGSRTATVVLPTNATINSCFEFGHLLNTPDTGMQDVTNMSKSAGTAGELRVKGIIPVANSKVSLASTTPTSMSSLLKPAAPIVAPSGAKIAFYSFGSSTTKELWALIKGHPI